MLLPSEAAESQCSAQFAASAKEASARCGRFLIAEPHLVAGLL